ncbi:hypothetical protein GOBAR_AA08766 [Gossypium barbadense]|uniref:Uncharacterized protein n=1 Tax=Gossypium barbadense TaxID=3634 RepID=A0A2P5Y8H4_GOSBA|nr:hypothetical protein GOBAR_AA08766 [Gossypium barbadense]
MGAEPPASSLVEHEGSALPIIWQYMTKESVKGHFAVYKLPSGEPMGLYSAYENSPTPYSFQPQHQQPETAAPAPYASMFHPHLVPHRSYHLSHRPGRFDTGVNPSTLPSFKIGNHKTKMW